MGFAGQVFAARVAIGLAVPSRKSLSATGQVLATGVKAIHRKIKQEAMASNLTPIHRKRLEDLNKITTSSAARTANLLKVKLEQNLKQLNSATQKSIKESFNKTGRNYDRLRSKLSKPIKQAFKGMDNLKGLQAAQQLARNMSMMTKRDRASVISSQARIVKGLDLEIQRKNQLIGLGRKKSGLSDTKYRKMVKEVKEEKKAYELEKKRLTVLQQIEGEVSDTVDEMEAMNTEGESWGDQVSSGADQIKENFNEALRNSVAILAAFGYKLQQSTSALIEFEKELLNANSVFNLTNDSLFNVGNEIIKFGNRFGIATQNGATGLYQLASAGLEADEAMKVLPETLKLSMAVQGDHNTISKLTAQTLFGFGMEMDQAAEVTDKFAYAIQKSLIEYQDLGSAVKFALPFFTSTGQSIDQLLGALQILTNRALEAGIAGRGLRQALAEFAESAMDAEVGFRKMGVEILNSNGEMMQLTEIAAQFAANVGPETASNTELLTTLIEDLNVRGATAFIHLVQASDEFTEAVESTKNAGGQLDEMVRIQNQSLSAQIQILKTNVFSIFAFRDAAYEGTDFINAFHKSIVTTVDGLRDLIIVEEDGEQRLTELGQRVQDLSVVFVEQFGVVLEETITLLSNLATSGKNFEGVIKLLFTPLKLIASVINKIPPGLLEMYLYWRMINSVIPLGTIAMWAYSRSLMAVAAAQIAVNATAMAGTGGMPSIIKGPGGKGFTWAGKGGRPFATKKRAIAGLGRAGYSAAPSIVRGAGMLGGAALGFSGLGTLALLAGLGGAYMLSKQASGGYVSPRAGGGMAGGNSPYLVGEQGPELFVPGSSGEIFNNKQTGDMLGSGQVVLKNVTIGIDSFGGLV
jgi:TP901 family phage tail tape measure protein